MIPEFVAKFEEGKISLAEEFSEHPPGDYKEIVTAVVSLLHRPDDYDRPSPDPARVHEINDGDCQGTRIYVIGSGDYQTSTYWVVAVKYGSCSSCDTLTACVTTEDYITLTRHIVEGLNDLEW